jgi:formylglycine-generating enzyme required for sulfatase activity
LLGFVEIPQGPFRMGTTPEEIAALVARFPDAKWLIETEGPQHEVTLARYYLARYPVTVAQFRAFVEASGHTLTDAASLRGAPDHPVVHVSWHDGLAYCDWLIETLRQWQGTPEPLGTLLRERRWRVTLPSEAQWEKAARGTDGRIYPWGTDADPERANYGETAIEATSSVGCFPRDASPFRCEDMSGNVWEWTRSLWGREWDNPDFRYPYNDTDGREELRASGVRRVLRGGAFDHVPQHVRCACRPLDDPAYRDVDHGFRGRGFIRVQTG